ncbi:PREDICTED: mucin-3A [Nicrophorus vespilloides]|uniref:Mucin-3A n=1 Tax=Nicrophorus vespilloides TaxID=110193 RepID=A0ABM1NIA6_NICVS|nr:PREDICTED: mucin-3A [Nicrophorus vespilloides]
MAKFKVLLLCLYLLFKICTSIEIDENSNSRESRKLFGGYRITPKFCEPTRRLSDQFQGPTICMFNHDCLQRRGVVVGACMDGFFFGACCHLPAETVGELLELDSRPSSYGPDNTIVTQFTRPPTFLGDITSSGVSHITNTLLQGALPTAQENAVFQINDQDHFSTAGVTHPTAPDTLVINNANNEINGEDFQPIMEDRKTTFSIEETTHPYIPDVSPYIQISISNAPPFYTTAPGFNKPIFRPKPQKPSDADKYILVPTINHEATKPNKTEIDSIVNIIQMLDETSTGTYTGGSTITTTRKPPSTSYVFSATNTKRPTAKPTTTPPRKTTTKNKTTTKKTTTKITSTKKPVYIPSSTFRPVHSTYVNSNYQTTKKPPSTSYVYSSTVTRRPTISQTSASPSPPTVIVLGSIDPTRYTTSKPSTYALPSPYTTQRPTTYTVPSKRPVTFTINNHYTQNVYSTSTERPSPTVLITPKPSTQPSTSFQTEAVEAETSADDLINFPPVRNPNLNMSIPVFDESDITTPDFIEDDILNTKVESFVNKIIEGLQEPFQGLKDVVYNKNKTAVDTTTKKPIKKQGTSRKPTSKPTTKPVVSTTAGKATTKRPTSKKPTTVITTKRTTVSTTTKRTKPTKKITTTPSYIEADEGTTPSDSISQDYRTQCGIRPLMKSGRIVGGKASTFGEFPWQVLVRESTWLGLFTKNKCGGVLISNRYVMTAAHCQPGFLASLVTVFGEFDISGELESKRAISRNVKRVIVHRQYDPATFENDLALLELEHPVQFDQHIIPICLPRDHEDFTGRMATVTGWGRLKYGGGVPSVLQEVQVPIMENTVCQEMFRTAGHSKVILESFLCAGYANGQKDSCEGDSGGPLVLQRPDGRYQLAGTVSHGIKCASPYLPGVYMRTTYYKPWIGSVTGIH